LYFKKFYDIIKKKAGEINMRTTSKDRMGCSVGHKKGKAIL